MPYKQRIKTLEECHRLVDDQLFQLERSGSTDTKKVSELRLAKDKYLNELRHMNRAQWDHDHETLDLDDER